MNTRAKLACALLGAALLFAGAVGWFAGDRGPSPAPEPRPMTPEVQGAEASGAEPMAAPPEVGEVGEEGGRATLVPAEPVQPGPDADEAFALALLPVVLMGSDDQVEPDGVIVVQRIDPAGGLEEYPRSPGNGPLRLAPGRVRVRAFAKLFDDPERDTCFDAAEASDDEVLELVAGVNPELTLRLEVRTGIHVTPRIEGFRGAVVRVVRVDPGEPIDDSMLLTGDLGEDGFGISRNGTGDATRTFMDLEPGLYAVSASDWVGLVYGYELVEVEVGVVELDLVAGALEGRRLSVSISGPGGAPVQEPERLILSLERARGEDKDVCRGVVTQGAEGPCSAWFPAEEGRFFDPEDATSSYAVVAFHERYGRARVPLQPGQVAATIALDASVSLSVRLNDFEPSDQRPISVRAVGLEQIEGGVPSLLTQFGQTLNLGSTSDGTGRLEGLRPGRHRVTVGYIELENGQLQFALLGWQVADARADGTLVEFDLPVVHEVRVSVPKGAEGAQVRLVPADLDELLRWDFEPLNRSLDADGRCDFKLVAPGAYTLEIEGRSEPVPVTVPCGEVVVR